MVGWLCWSVVVGPASYLQKACRKRRSVGSFLFFFCTCLSGLLQPALPCFLFLFLTLTALLLRSQVTPWHSALRQEEVLVLQYD